MEDIGGNGTRYRLDDLARRVAELERRSEAEEVARQKLAVASVELQYLKEDMEEIKSTVRWILRTLVALSVTIIGGVVIYAVANGGPGA